MAIYSKSVRALMREGMTAALASAQGEIFSKQQAIDWFAMNYPKIKMGTVIAHLIRLSTNAPSRAHYSAKAGEDDVFFQLDGSHFRLYQPAQDPLPIYTVPGATEATQKTQVEDHEEDVAAQGSGQFAYETDLRNYLVKNLCLVEAGLRLYEDEGITGIEFPVGGRFIDILALDSTGALVVIELKVSRGYDRVVGQLMRNMAWVRENQADAGQRVRGIIVAREITEDLFLACSLVPDIKLYEYQLSLSLNQVQREQRT